MSNELEKVVLNNLSTREEYEVLLQSGALPKGLNTAEKLMAVVQTGKELGLTAMVSLNNINVIEGKTVLSAALLGALLKRRGIAWKWTKDHEVDPTNPERIITELEFRYICPITKSLERDNFSVSWGQMVLAGYTEKQNWRKYPKEMLRSRCLSYATRAYFPEVIMAFYIDEEIVDATNAEKYDIVINEEGEAIVIEKEDN
jgi:hypothetical protein